MALFHAQDFSKKIGRVGVRIKKMYLLQIFVTPYYWEISSNFELVIYITNNSYSAFLKINKLFLILSYDFSLNLTWKTYLFYISRFFAECKSQKDIQFSFLHYFLYFRQNQNKIMAKRYQIKLCMNCNMIVSSKIKFDSFQWLFTYLEIITKYLINNIYNITRDENNIQKNENFI